MNYHEGARALQDRFDSRRLADRLAERMSRAAFTDEDRAFIESRMMFFFATADAAGQPDCSYKGGMPGFVRVNPRVGLLFLDFEQPRRLRVNGTARLEDPSGEFEGAQLVIRVRADTIFPNCPRYIHRLQMVEASAYAPRPGHEPPVPAWKQHFKDVLPG